ncbi:hypothetical protein V1525DRAFT_398352 [Lipomyces kononenkoae]|uniref:Uncharacterized protein n=1 Tax=Lipomyces kononenkoae TaxID=34357 RepID=A0ACC3T5Q6_LIPKO
MDNIPNNNAGSPSGAEPTPGQHPGGPFNVVFVNYTFTYSPHPHRNVQNPQNPQDISRGSPETGENAGPGAEGNRGQTRADGPFHGFVVYGVPQLFDNVVFNGFGGPFAMGEPPKPRASKAAIDALKDVDIKTIPESDRTCPICFDPYYEEPAEQKGVDMNMIDVTATANKECPTSSAAGSAKLEEIGHSHDTESRQPKLTSEAEETAATYTESQQHESTGSNENRDASPRSGALDHVPLQMPCGHIFGKYCLKEWLTTSTTCPLCRTAIEAEPLQRPQQQGRFDGGFPFVLAPLFSLFRRTNQNQETRDGQNQTEGGQQQSQPQPQSQPSPPVSPAAAPSSATAAAPQSVHIEPSVNRSSSSGSSYAVRHHPYSRPTESSTSANTSSASSTESLSSVLARPDLECESALLGLCEESGPYIRLDCGHGYHEGCLRTAMRTHGDVEIPNLRNESNISTLASDQPRVRREVWCMRCRRYREVDA